jgi:hypothetical protein
MDRIITVPFVGHGHALFIPIALYDYVLATVYVGHIVLPDARVAIA